MIKKHMIWGLRLTLLKQRKTHSPKVLCCCPCGREEHQEFSSRGPFRMGAMYITPPMATAAKQPRIQAASMAFPILVMPSATPSPMSRHS
eukprot:5566603-Amphidinium_carterae.1